MPGLLGSLGTISTAGNDVINGIVSTVAGATTLDASDTVNGGLGANTLNITVAGTATATDNGALISNVQTINVRNIGSATATLDASTVGGLTAFNANVSTGDVAVSNLESGATGGVIGNGTLSNGDAYFGWGSTVTSGTVNLSDGVTAGRVILSGSALASVTVNSTGATNVLDGLALGGAATALAINAATSLTTGGVTGFTGTTAAITISGAATNVNLGTLEASTVKTVTASGLTAGGVTMTLNDTLTSFTGGAGVDTVTTVSGAKSTAVVNGGDGSADILVLADTTSLSTAALGARFTNFEILRNTSGASADLTNITGIATLQTGASGSGFVDMSAAQAASVVARANAGDVTLTLATATGISDVLGFTLGTTTTNALTAGTLTATGFETINLVAHPGSTATAGSARTSTVGAITDTSLTTVNLTGPAFTITDIASTNAVTWDGSALTGNGDTATDAITGLTVSGSAHTGSTITGSALRDSFTVGAIGSTYDGGTGNDLFTATIANAAGSTLVGGVGTDTLALSDAGTIADSTFSHVTGFETLTIAASTTLTSGGFFNSAFGGSGATTVTASASGGDTLDFSTVVATLKVTETAGTNVITGSSTAVNTITGCSAFDTITGGSGADVLSGGGGDDYILGGVGLANKMIGGTGSDYLRADGLTAVPESATAASDVNTMFGGAVSVLNPSTGIYAESVDSSMSSGLQASFASVYGPNWPQAYTDYQGANIYEGKGGNDILVASSQKDVFLYKTFDQVTLNANVGAYPTLSAQNYLGTDKIENFKVGTDFLGVVMALAGEAGDLTFVSGASGSQTSSQFYVKASTNGWSITASTATTATLTFDASTHTDYTDGGLGTLGDFSVTFVGLQNYTSGTTAVDAFFISSAP